MLVGRLDCDVTGRDDQPPLLARLTGLALWLVAGLLLLLLLPGLVLLAPNRVAFFSLPNTVTPFSPSMLIPAFMLFMLSPALAASGLPSRYLGRGILKILPGVVEGRICCGDKTTSVVS